MSRNVSPQQPPSPPADARGAPRPSYLRAPAGALEGAPAPGLPAPRSWKRGAPPRRATAHAAGAAEAAGRRTPDRRPPPHDGRAPPRPARPESPASSASSGSAGHEPPVRPAYRVLRRPAGMPAFPEVPPAIPVPSPELALELNMLRGSLAAIARETDPVNARRLALFAEAVCASLRQQAPAAGA